MPDPYASVPQLRFDRPAAGVFRVTLDGPGLNAVGHDPASTGPSATTPL